MYCGTFGPLFLKSPETCPDLKPGDTFIKQAGEELKSVNNSSLVSTYDSVDFSMK